MCIRDRYYLYYTTLLYNDCVHRLQSSQHVSCLLPKPRNTVHRLQSRQHVSCILSVPHNTAVRFHSTSSAVTSILFLHIICTTQHFCTISQYIVCSHVSTFPAYYLYHTTLYIVCSHVSTLPAYYLYYTTLLFHYSTHRPLSRLHVSCILPVPHNTAVKFH